MAWKEFGKYTCTDTEGGAAQGCGRPKLAAVATTVTGELGLALEEDSLGVLQGADSPSLQIAPLVPGSVAAVTATCKRVQGRERERRETNTGVSGKGTLCPPQPRRWGWHQQGGLSSCPSPLPHPHHGSKEQLQNTALSQAGDGPLCSGQLPGASRGAR